MFSESNFKDKTTLRSEFGSLKISSAIEYLCNCLNYMQKNYSARAKGVF